MSEELDQERVQKPTIQARYRYLADFSKQESPNLRKQYRQSLSPHQISNHKRSPSRKCSPYRSSHKKISRIQRYSPSCSTFNPRREHTQQQFSPYDDRADKEQERINNQLRQQNMELRAQIIQSKQIIDSLRAELSRRDMDLLQIRENSQADLCYFEKVVAQMTGEIQIVLTKNKILQNELIVVKSRLHEQTKRVEEYARYEEERKRTEKRKLEINKIQDQRRLIDQRRKEDLDREEQKLKEITNKNASQPSRRSVGKLMSKPTAHQYQSKNQSLQTSKIKIQDEMQTIGRQNCENRRVDNLPPRPHTEKQKQAKKGQQLIQSILGMQLKITGRQATSLKQLWKWLKEMGHSQSCLKKWKPKAQAGIYLNSERLRQLVKQACSYIQ